MIDDPYQVLGVSPDASPDEIKKHTAPWRRNTTPTSIPMIRRPLGR